MNVEPIINVRFKKFKDSYELNSMADGDAFERFVNHAILTAHQPDAFSADEELLDTVCVGGSNDMGIDGLAIKLNGLLVRNIADIKDILDKFRRASVEIIFIQSKYKDSFNMGEFNNFIAGVRDFLQEAHLQPMNDKIKEFLKMKDFLLSEDVVITWEDNPSVRLYYVAMGKWRNSPHHVGLADQFKKDIAKLNTYINPEIHFIDSDTLRDVCDSNENTFTASLSAIDSMPLTAVVGVDNSCLFLCYADEYMKLITTEDKIIRKSLFEDNVRDYQGENNVNSEIEDTVKTDPEKFILLNNGITIVCDDYVPSNRTITLKNPQVVNGCQTSHVIYYCGKKGIDVSKVPLSIKVIATKNLDITNQIVRGTNRQNIVYDEAFEITKKFHKDLEEFFNAVSVDQEKIYYERRSKQYQHNPRIKQTEKINLRILTQAFIAMFLNKPHVAHRHESKLLKEYANTIYQDHQSRLPYYTAALTFYVLEKYFREAPAAKKEFYAFRFQLLMIFRELIAGPCPNINKEKESDSHCKLILDSLKDKAKTQQFIEKAKSIFADSKNMWTVKLGKSSFGIKDISEFSELLLSEVCKVKNVNCASKEASNQDRYNGKVVKVIVDRLGVPCGFIRRTPDDVFFHLNSNKGLDFKNLEGKYVSYKLEMNTRTNRPVAVNVSIEQSEQSQQ